MKELILYLITFLISYLFYVIFVLCRKNVLKKFPDGKEARYLKYKYNVKITDKNIKKVANSVFLVNAFILSTTVYIVCLFNNFILGLIVGMIVILILILFMYHILGMIFKGKGGKHV